MKRSALESSSLSEAGYDPDRQMMEVEFRNGGLYRYLDVPAEVYREFEGADSKGRFLNLRIKPAYRCLRVRPARR